MVESNQDEERLARVERMLAQCQRELKGLKATAVSKVVVTMKPTPLAKKSKKIA